MLYDPKDQLSKLPERPGIYMMRDGGGAIIYVGKAKNIKNRFRSYFQPSNAHIPKIMGIRTNMQSFEYIAVENEVEALMLEFNLIKEHRPHYNVKLKDDRAFPYIRVTVGEPFPRAYVERTCDVFSADSQYFGPYVDVMSVRAVVDMIHNIWPLRRCKKTFAEPAEGGEMPRPCLYHHIGQCKAPCAGLISKDEYAKLADEFTDFLKGKHDEIVAVLNDEMDKAAEAMHFERAAALRDKIRSVKTLRIRQRVSIIKRGDTDIIAYATDNDEALAQVFFVREGHVIGREHHLLENISDTPESEVMAAFITQFYGGTPFVPKEIVLQREPADMDVIAEWLSTLRNGKVSLTVPQKGEKLKLVEMAYENAVLQLKQFGDIIKKDIQRTHGAAKEIFNALNLDFNDDARFEAYDISNTQGINPVASMVVFEHGKPKRNDYRKFKIKTVRGANDFASMEEVLTRRMERYKAEKDEEAENRKKFSKLPDIILVDGGKPQISAAEGVLAKLGYGIPVCGMVKDERHRTKGLLYNNEEIPLPKHSEGFKLLTRIQDEVHRFAIEYHKLLRQKASIHSVLDDIPGIGQVRRTNLVKHFGSVDKIRAATAEELLEVESMNKKTAKIVWEFFNENKA